LGTVFKRRTRRIVSTQKKRKRPKLSGRNERGVGESRQFLEVAQRDRKGGKGTRVREEILGSRKGRKKNISEDVDTRWD